MRQLTTPHGVYKWKAGESGVVIMDPKGKKRFVSLIELGINPEVFDRGQCKKTSDGSITPSIVAKWINEHGPDASVQG